ncbi:O-methyltransferase [Halorubrum sp. CBA1229]|jgi:predicted O-methyltransferase YrrM|uniref:O-methyltransferase n=1 Tax=Halorubrum sp. CBA1229 TaxID=1853699 RepID=UPI000F3DA08C|nr:O-methyltransferase [Halorubrum sp. CBA1229]QKY15358.1 O-methyltransferase [Halorubrum sp. CBA1229]
MDVLSDPAERFLAATAPEHTATQAAMAELADDWGFPIIGPEAGSVLRLLARLTDARRVFEFGSGFGYSATWFLRGGAEAVICTEFDADEAERGVRFAADGGYADRVTFEVGDAMETIERYDGPFDIALIDHQKSRYAEAYRTVLPKVRTGGVIVADNITRGPIDFADLVAHFEEGAPLPDPERDGETRGIGEYVGAVRSDDAVETAILPVGSGIAVSTKVA